MPSYKVRSRGFFNGKLYDPEGKRPILFTDKPFSKKSMPSWLTSMPKESAAVKAKREAQEVSQAEADTEKAEQDQNDIAHASTEGDAAETSFIDKATDGAVETL